ncbi:hypothetical protein P3S67_022494 [Capsicum chacoense]
MESLDISISPDLSDVFDDDENEELEKFHREQDEEWMTLCQLAGGHKPCNEQYLSFFKDCIGALDGTYVEARLLQGQEILYIGRKGYLTQNILAVVDFNMCFTFALVEWEGSAHDNHICCETLCRQELNFPHPLKNKYYLVDSGYSHTKGYMAPYRGDNLRKKCNVDNVFQTAENKGYIPSFDFDVGTTSTASNIDGENMSEESNVHWVWLRDMIANDICNA